MTREKTKEPKKETAKKREPKAKKPKKEKAPPKKAATKSKKEKKPKEEKHLLKDLPARKTQILLAGGNAGQLSILRQYGEEIPGVEICGTATDCSQVLRLLQRPQETDALFLDLYLRGGTLLGLLEQIDALHLAHRPHILVSMPVVDEAVRGKLMMLGVDDVIQKPYSLKECYQSILFYSNSAEDYKVERVNERIAWHLSELRIQRSCTGYWLMAYALQILIQNQRECGMTKEVYPTVGKADSITNKGVESGIRRAIETAWDAGTAEYEAVRAYIAAGKNKPAANAAFLNRLAQMIALELSY